MRKVFISVLLALLVACGSTPALAVPALPHAFYGSVSVNGAPAIDGTQVSATVDDGTIIPTQNPVSTVGGNYGVDNPRLLVQGDIPPGATITFHVTNTDGTAASGTYDFEPGGGPTPFNISVTITPEPEPEPTPTPTGGGGPIYNNVETNFCGLTGVFNIDYTGKVIQSITAGCEYGGLTITIEKDTIALDENDNPLQFLTIQEVADPPSLPEGDIFVSLPFMLSPSGATFDPALIFTWSYDPEDIPEGETPSIVYWDSKEWITLTGVVDPVNNIVTAEVNHFTTFALTVAEPPPPVTVEPIKPVVPTEPDEPIEPPPTEPEPVDEEPEAVVEPLEPEEPEKEVPIWVYFLTGAFVVIIFVLVWWLRKKRRKHF